jgi:hypothetical protein
VTTETNAPEEPRTTTEQRVTPGVSAETAEQVEPPTFPAYHGESCAPEKNCWICEQPEAQNRHDEEFYLDSLRAMMRLTSNGGLPGGTARITAGNCNRRPLNTAEIYDCWICEQPEVKQELETGVHYGAVNWALCELSQHGTPIEEVMRVTRYCNLIFGVWFVDESNGRSSEDNFFDGIFVTDTVTQRGGISGMSIYSLSIIGGGGASIIDFAYGGSPFSPEEDVALWLEHFGEFSLSGLILSYPMLSPSEWFERFPEFSREEWVAAILEITPFMWETRHSKLSSDEWVEEFSDNPDVARWAAQLHENSGAVSDVF